MRISRIFGVAALALTLAASTGCSNDLKAERDRLKDENLQLRDDLADARTALQSCEDERGDLTEQNSKLRMQLADSSSSAQPANQPQSDDTGFEGIQGVSGETRPGEVSAVVEGDMLFASGSVDLKAEAKRSLDKVASVLNSEYSGLMIRIEGHTDNDPIRRSKWGTNDRLSCERAMAVKEYLKTRGVDSSRMYVAGFGPIRIKESKVKSRRVEVVVLTQ